MVRTGLMGAVLSLVLIWPVAGGAQTQTVPPSLQAMQMSFAPVVKRVTPAVVNVYARRVENQRRNPIFDDPFFQQFFGGGAAEPRQRVQQSLGSGVIVRGDGLVVTNNHVIDGATEVRVALSDRREFEAEVVLTDKRADLAVLRLKGVKEQLPTLEFAPPDSLQVGDLVLAVGDPFGVGQTVTSGIVSALARSQTGTADFQSYIQTDAAINPGNSGGALVDMSGRLVGINSAIYTRSGGSIGIGFAIPAAMVAVVVRSAEAGATQVQRPFLGATLQDVTSEIAETFGLDRPQGALVTATSNGGPAQGGGMRIGDLILEIDGVPVADADDFGYRFATKPLGGVTSVTVLRAGRRLVLPVALKIAPETTPRNEVMLEGRGPLAGAVVANLSPRVAEDIGLPVSASGVVVMRVEDGSPAASVGFRPKDIVMAVNDEVVTDSGALAEIAKVRRRVWQITIIRDGQRITSVFGG